MAQNYEKHIVEVATAQRKDDKEWGGNSYVQYKLTFKGGNPEFETLDKNGQKYYSWGNFSGKVPPGEDDFPFEIIPGMKIELIALSSKTAPVINNQLPNQGEPKQYKEIAPKEDSPSSERKYVGKEVVEDATPKDFMSGEKIAKNKSNISKEQMPDVAEFYPMLDNWALKDRYWYQKALYEHQRVASRDFHIAVQEWTKLLLEQYSSLPKTAQKQLVKGEDTTDEFMIKFKLVDRARQKLFKLFKI